MGARTIYRVAVDCVDCTKGPHRVRVLVIAGDPHEALDQATEHPNASELYDEEIQRAIADGEIREEHIDRKYDGYLEEVEYVGEVDRDKRHEDHVEAFERMQEDVNESLGGPRDGGRIS